MKRLSKSIRKYIRQGKARIRREALDTKEQERLIKELYGRFMPKPKEEKAEIEKAEPEKTIKKEKEAEKAEGKPKVKAAAKPKKKNKSKQGKASPKDSKATIRKRIKEIK